MIILKMKSHQIALRQMYASKIKEIKLMVTKLESKLSVHCSVTAFLLKVQSVQYQLYSLRISGHRRGDDSSACSKNCYWDHKLLKYF